MRAEIVDGGPRRARRGRDPRPVAATGSWRTSRPSPAAGTYAEHLRVTVFAPDDLAVVKGGPAGRRDFVDELLEASGAAVRGGEHRLRARAEAAQRVAARRGPRRGGAHDARRARRPSGRERRRARRAAPRADRATHARGIAEAYESLAGVTPGHGDARTKPSGATATLTPTRSTRSTAMLRDALETLRKREEDRGVTLVGPHRDDWTFVLDGSTRAVTRRRASSARSRSGCGSPGHRLVADDRRQRPAAAARRRVQRARPAPRGRAGRAPARDPDAR